MWKLPLFGCTDSAQVLKEVEECKKEYPGAFIRIIGFDNSSGSELFLRKQQVVRIGATLAKLKTWRGV
jgi:ribulose bisphosphate carboxylase small subunit